MKRLFALADEYLDQSDWKVLAALKFCLLSLGVLIGLYAPRRYRRSLTLTCVPLFLLTYLPLMDKLFRIWREQNPPAQPAQEEADSL